MLHGIQGKLRFGQLLLKSSKIPIRAPQRLRLGLHKVDGGFLPGAWHGPHSHKHRAEARPESRITSSVEHDELHDLVLSEFSRTGVSGSSIDIDPEFELEGHAEYRFQEHPSAALCSQTYQGYMYEIEVSDKQERREEDGPRRISS
ncbi:hypothetical protein R1flu_000661 [Riccia fluitans]|uniref:Uncharacterized protein n=1 Tax=Riccia fluitans TaxID=41844 RepID=A0ABD1Y132_9MARC